MSKLGLKPLPLSRPHLGGNEKRYVEESITSGKLAGDGPFTKKVAAHLQAELSAKRVLLTTSCTSALELAAVLLLDGDYAERGVGGVKRPSRHGDRRQPGDRKREDRRDEIVIPAFTFVSTVNAFLLHGWRPVFCDVRFDTGSVDAETIAPHINARTRAVCPVHYAGAPAQMGPIMRLAEKSGVAVVEDAAQALYAKVDGRYAGTIGDVGAFSFHDTKNWVCGEGGALVINRDDLLARAEIVREKGTNRSQFLLGHIDKYTWVDVGGSFLAADPLAAFLLAQLEMRAVISEKRNALYVRYAENFAASDLVRDGRLSVPAYAKNVETNHHIFFIVVESADVRARLMKHLNGQGIGAAFHYPALHMTPMGKHLHGDRPSLPNAEALGERLLRLPLFADMTADDVDRVADSVAAFYR